MTAQVLRRAWVAVGLLLCFAGPTLAQQLPRIRLVATGGTIADNGTRRLTHVELLAAAADLPRFSRPESEQFSNVPSGALTLGDWLRLSRRVNELLEATDLSGVVITTGTDTLEETAYFLNLTVRSPKPVVIAGAMRNPDTPGADGTANLIAAFRVAAEPASHGQGVLVVLNERIHGARDVTKDATTGVDAFRSSPFGPLGLLDGPRVVYYRRSLRRHTASSEFDVSGVGSVPRVDVFLTYQDSPGDLLRAAVDLGARGLVVAGAGAGATSGTQEAGIRYALERGVVVVMSSRAGSGRVAPEPDAVDPSPAPAARLMLPVVADDLSPLKARVLLMLALTRTRDRADIQRMFLEY
ncbi:MAG: asparaginase [Vicinamibacterales bacterium]